MHEQSRLHARAQLVAAQEPRRKAAWPEEVTAAGGEVRTLPFVTGLSTSAIIGRAKDSLS